MRWLDRITGSKRREVHPPWKAGPYVTYFLERQEGSWTAMALRLRGQMKDGSWALSADIKTSAGECTAWFRSDPAADGDPFDPFPEAAELVRGLRSTTGPAWRRSTST